MRSHPNIDAFAAAALIISMLAASCTNEASTPLDLDATTTTTVVGSAPPPPEDDPNAQARSQVVDFAKEQCRLHPEREFGVVVIADADGNEVNRYEFPCAELDEVESDQADR